MFIQIVLRCSSGEAIQMIRSFSLIFLFLITIDANTRVKSRIFNDSLALWDLFRDPENGAYCDTIRFDPAIPCGTQNNRYSSAGKLIFLPLGPFLFKS